MYVAKITQFKCVASSSRGRARKIFALMRSSARQMDGFSYKNVSSAWRRTERIECAATRRMISSRATVQLQGGEGEVRFKVVEKKEKFIR